MLTIFRQDSTSTMALRTSPMDHPPRALGNTIPRISAVKHTLHLSRLLLFDHSEFRNAYLLHDRPPHTVLERVYHVGTRVCSRQLHLLAHRTDS